MTSTHACSGLAAALLLAAAAACSTSEPKSGGTSGTGGTRTTGSGGTGTGSGGTGTTASGSGGTGTTASGSGGTGTTASGSGTGTGGATGSTTGAGGAGGTTVAQKLCAKKTKLMSPVLLNFENYDGTVTADNYSTAFGGAAANTGDAYAGPFAYGDNSATPTLAIMAGRPPGQWAVSESVTHATAWGMGGGFWMGCTDATSYKGISFWVRGSSGPGTFSFNLNMENTTMPDAVNPAGGGTCSGTTDTCKAPAKEGIPITADWTQVQILWADFTPGMSAGTAVVPDGNNITGLGWNVPLKFQLDPSSTDPIAGPYVPVPGDLTINIDDVSFIP